MRKKASLQFVVHSLIYLIAFGFPVLLIAGSEGWNAGSMKASSYLIDNEMIKSLTDLILNLVFMSSFLLGLPILIYVFVVIGFAKLLSKFLLS